MTYLVYCRLPDTQSLAQHPAFNAAYDQEQAAIYGRVGAYLQAFGTPVCREAANAYAMELAESRLAEVRSHPDVLEVRPDVSVVDALRPFGEWSKTLGRFWPDYLGIDEVSLDDTPTLGDCRMALVAMDSLTPNPLQAVADLMQRADVLYGLLHKDEAGAPVAAEHADPEQVYYSVQPFVEDEFDLGGQAVRPYPCRVRRNGNGAWIAVHPDSTGDKYAVLNVPGHLFATHAEAWTCYKEERLKAFLGRLADELDTVRTLI